MVDRLRLGVRGHKWPLPPNPPTLWAAGFEVGTIQKTLYKAKPSAGRWHPLKRMKEERIIKQHEDLRSENKHRHERNIREET